MHSASLHCHLLLEVSHHGFSFSFLCSEIGLEFRWLSECLHFGFASGLRFPRWPCRSSGFSRIPFQ
jgi:hypothetical protein